MRRASPQLACGFEPILHRAFSKAAAAEHSKWAITAILVLAFGLRVGLWVARERGLITFFGPPMSFWVGGNPEWTTLAENLINGNGYHFSTELFGDFRLTRPPLYPLFLAAFLRLFGQADLPAVLGQAAVGTVSVVLTFLIASRLFGRRQGLVAALAAAIYPYYLNHDTYRQEIVLLTLLTAAGVLFLLRAGAGAGWADPLAAGVMLGLAALTRQTLLAFVPLAATWLGLFASRRRSRSVLLLLLGLAVVVSPWVARNAMLVGRPVFTVSTGFGLWWSHNPVILKYYPWETIDKGVVEYWYSVPADVRARVAALPPLERDDWWRVQALAYMRANPGEVARGVGLNALVGFGLIKSPLSGDVRDIIFPVLHLILLGLAGLGAWMSLDRWRESLLFVLVFVSYLAPTLLTWSHTGHRIFLDLYLMVLASVPIAAALPAVAQPRVRP